MRGLVKVHVFVSMLGLVCERLITAYVFLFFFSMMHRPFTLHLTAHMVSERHLQLLEKRVRLFFIENVSLCDVQLQMSSRNAMRGEVMQIIHSAITPQGDEMSLC